MNQMRTILLIALMMVGYVLWTRWQADYPSQPVVPPTTQQQSAAVPQSNSDSNDVPSVPQNTSPSLPTTSNQSAPSPALVQAKEDATLNNQVLSLGVQAQGTTLMRADLLKYDQHLENDVHEPVRLLDGRNAHLYMAQYGYLSADPASAPTHKDAFVLGNQSQGTQIWVWDNGQGIRLERTLTLQPDGYVLAVEDKLTNQSGQSWQGFGYQQLIRTEPAKAKSSGLINPENYSFVGGAWYTPEDKFSKISFDEFADESPDVVAKGSWLAMLQHYFIASWILPNEENNKISTETLDGRYLIRAVSQDAWTVAPGQSGTRQYSLLVGPKLQNQLDDIAPGLGLSMNYGVFTVLAKPMFWVLSKLHSFTGNWGWAIVLLVLLIKLAMFKLSEAQYKSFARMRSVQPRLEALKERFGDDRQQYQAEMMKLYKKEKINPVGGCLPMLIQMPIFLSLYWVLLESVELRQAPWILWVQDLSQPDPFFVLPVLNLVAMFLTQRLTPMTGMDPTQKKMMQFMPLVFGVMFAFFPAGLVLYWATNGWLGLFQQWFILRRHGHLSKA